MLFKYRLALVFAFVFAVSAALPAGGLAARKKPPEDTFKAVLNKNGKSPATVLVEQPHEALKAWRRANAPKRPLILICANLGIVRMDEYRLSHALDGMGKGLWDDILSKDYPTLKNYAVNPTNYLYLAHKAGLIDRVYWVPPSKDPVGEESLDSFKDYLRGLGVAETELGALKQTEASISGVLNGVPVEIYRLQDLPRVRDEALLLMDLSYLVQLYQDEVKTPMLDLFGGFINTLGARDVRVSKAAVSFSTAAGPVPLDLRFLGYYMRRYLTKPGSLAAGPPPAWMLRSEAMYFATFFQPEDMLDSFHKAIKLEPRDPSLKYALAVAHFQNKDLTSMRGELDEAVKADRGYYPFYLEMAGYFIGKEMAGDAEHFAKKAAGANPDDPRCWYALYRIYFSAGTYDKAEEALKKKMALGFSDPETLRLLAEVYARQDNIEMAVKTYKEALSKISGPERQARVPFMLGLAEAYEKGKRIKEALETYGEILQSTDDEHVKQRVNKKVEKIKADWAPFLGS